MFSRFSMRRLGRIGIFLLLLINAGCAKKRAYIHNYAPKELSKPLPCLAMEVSPPDLSAEKTLKALYPFANQCPYRLVLTTKDSIVCHSNGNAPLKATPEFPSAYLRLELRHGLKLLYSYYIDLTSPPDAGTFKRLLINSAKTSNWQGRPHARRISSGR